jgi:pyruvate formate lyase activating enzyme
MNISGSLFCAFIVMIFNIQRFSTHDGNGIRTMIFYKGCPLRCEWCCNPESQSFGYSILFDPGKCNSFGDCLLTRNPGITRTTRGIEIDRNVLSDPENLRNVCLSRAIQISGEEKSLEDLLIEIERDLPFYQHSGGGVTLSGGEPLSQGKDLVKLLTLLKNKDLDVAMETSLHVDWPSVERCLGLVSTYLVDVKHTDAGKFQRFTGGNLELVLQNMTRLVALKENVIARIPVIPGFNHTTEEIEKIVDFIASLKHVNEIHFLPYHTLGTQKYAMLGMEYAFGKKKPVDESGLSNYIDYARNKGFAISNGG